MGSSGAKPEGDPRVEELLRVNAELAAELRSLSLGRRDVARPGPVPAARRMAALDNERDEALARARGAETELKALREEREALLRRNGELEREVVRLRSGPWGLLRRLRARLLRA